jgi:hypothetical protein
LQFNGLRIVIKEDNEEIYPGFIGVGEKAGFMDHSGE